MTVKTIPVLLKRGDWEQNICYKIKKTINKNKSIHILIIMVPV